FLLLAVIQGVLAGEPTSMLRAITVEAPVSVLGMVLLVAVTQLLLGLTDAASAMVLQGAPGDLGHFLSGFGSSATVATGGVEAAVVAQGISRGPVRAGQGGLQAGYYAQGLSRLTGGKAGASRGAAGSGGSDGAAGPGAGPTGAPAPGTGPATGGAGGAGAGGA